MALNGMSDGRWAGTYAEWIDSIPRDLLIGSKAVWQRLGHHEQDEQQIE